MRKRAIGVAALGAAGLWLALVSPPSPAAANDEALWRHRNLGKALYEMPTTQSEAPAELKKALDLAPGSFRDRLNYGLALLRAGEAEAGIAQLEQAQKQEPTSPYTWFNLGIAYKRAGRFEDALKQFEQMVKLVPDEPVSHYNLGLLYELNNKPEEGFKQFEVAGQLDANFVAPRFKIYNYYRLHDQEAAAKKALGVFQELKKQQQAAGDSEDVEWSFWAELYDPVVALPAARDTSPPADIKFDDRLLRGDFDSATAGLLALDADHDGKPDLLAWSKSGLKLYRGGTELVANSGLEMYRDVVSVAAGDFDDDGFADLCVLTADAPHIAHNVKGRFEEKPAPLPKRRFDAAFWHDFDHDYDADLFLFGGEPALVRNNGGGSFEDSTSRFPFERGRVSGVAAARVVPDSKGLDFVVAYADHTAVLYRDQLRGVFQAVRLAAIPAGASQLRVADADNDSWLDIGFLSGGVAHVAFNKNGSFAAKPYGAGSALAFADLENRGWQDLVSKGVQRNAGMGSFGELKAWGMLDAVAFAAADFDGDGRTDLAAISRDGKLHLLANRTVTRNQSLRIALTGVKNMKLAPNTEVEVKAGQSYQKRLFEGVPIVVGTGLDKQIDTVRITWANGLIQNESNQVPGKQLAFKEAPRLSGSCPMIFTWNGREFEFITDVLGVAPLGAGLSDGATFPLDHDEYVSIPGSVLKAADGRYQVRITEELHEVSYLDQVRLIAVDHPAHSDVYTNEKFKSPPFPEFRLFGVSERVYAASARDGEGRDVRTALSQRDGRYAMGFEHDAAGVAGMHSLTLDFGPRAAGDAVLFANGWVDWADGSTFVGTSQNPKRQLVMPYLQVRDSAGQWSTVVEDMGIPAGKPKTIAVPVRFLSSSREVRIVTNLCLYWDEMFLSNQVAPPEVRMTTLDALRADVRLRGFSEAVIHERREQPEAFRYAKWSPGGQWNQTPGLYTRYGDVRTLLTSADDRMVIMGAGDEVQLEFDARALTPVPAGWRRDFLLLVDGWAKDADANTAYSQTVEPLPFHAMSGYPYRSGEKFPDDAAHREYLRTYNTRPAVRFVRPLVAGR